MATEILRPNGAGDATGVESQVPASGAHWDKVDEAVADDATTYVKQYAVGTTYDYYALQDTALTTETVDSLDVTYRGYCWFDSGGSYLTGGVRLSATNVLDVDKQNQSAWTTYTKASIGRPGGGSWAVGDLNSLQAAVKCIADAWDDARVTQIYITVNYTAGGTAYTRSVAGAQGSGTGTLARKFSAKRALAGAQACGTGILTRIQNHIRGLLAGAQDCGTGTLTRIQNHIRAVAGVVASGTGTLARKLQAVRSVAGSVASGTGTLSRAATYKRALAGAQQVGAGMLTRSQHRLRSLAGLQPAPSGILSALKTVIRPHALKGTARAVGNWFKAQGRFKK